ncbi:acyltransferase family protein [Caballeronia sp. S22]|uniref:acyltransferase family protein n=1 Tax=Caballeronia sp. S22 TaxID=3137182 RepID=UPI00353121C6
MHGAAGQHKYRGDIDGLRAIAVILVVAFHAFPSLLKGGFVGVDVFFVISGFLITGILLSDLTGGRYSLGGFYGRRIRRIFPALTIVLVAVCLAGWFCLFKDELQKLGWDIAAGAAFVANLALWGETGYFDRAAEVKPLLHLWSIGIEEQFYIVWPLILRLAYKRRPVLIAAIAICFLASFAFNVQQVHSHPAAAFYSPFSRFWELAAGGLLAVLSKRESQGARLAKELVSCAGLALIVCAVCLITAASVFPGWWALLPVAGAVALIWAGPDCLVNRHLLSLRPMVWIGKISYPLYLWHWPLLSFTTILTGQAPAPQMRFTLVIVSVLLAWATYLFIEKPVRFARSRSVSVALPCVALMIVSGCGAAVNKYESTTFGDKYVGGPDPATAVHGDGHIYIEGGCGVPKDEETRWICVQDKRERPHIVMWGDSKTEALYWGPLRKSSEGKRWAMISRASCAPFTGVAEARSPRSGRGLDQCLSANEVALRSMVADRNIQTVVIAAAMRDVDHIALAKKAGGRVDPTGALDGLSNSISALEAAGKRVIFVIDNPTLPDPKQCVVRHIATVPGGRQFVEWSRHGLPDLCSIPLTKHLQVTADYRRLVMRLQEMHPDMLVYDPASVLCDMPKGVCPISKDGKFLYSYGDHVSDYANGLLADDLLAKMAGRGL